MTPPPQNAKDWSHGEPPLEDGVYQVDHDRHLLIHRGALYLPANMVPPLVPIRRASLVHAVMPRSGWQQSFVRAADIAGACPDLAATAREIAARLGCSL